MIAGDKPKIGIVGCGIGGASAAFFLNELFPKSTIDIYEKEPKVGGRADTVEIGGRHYDSGASVIHDKNQYLVEFRKKLGLKKRKKSGGGALFSVYDGLNPSRASPNRAEAGFLFKPWPYVGSFVNTVRLIWACGLVNFIKLTLCLRTIMHKFSRIYRLQAEGKKSFETVGELVDAIGLLPLTKVSLRRYVAEKCGISREIVSRLVLPAMRCNYGQGMEVQSLVGMVSIAAGIDGSLWSFHGGNRAVVEAIVQSLTSSAPAIKDRPRATVRLLTGTTVERIALKSTDSAGPRFSIYFSPANAETGLASREAPYDIVILALPLAKNPEIHRMGFDSIVPDPYDSNALRYHELWVYLCDAQSYAPNGQKFGYVRNGAIFGRSLFCDGILTTTRDYDGASGGEDDMPDGHDGLLEKSSHRQPLRFNSIGFQRPVDYSRDRADKNFGAWKIFSNEHLPNHYVAGDLLETLSTEKNNPDGDSPTPALKSVRWHAYPEYSGSVENAEQKSPSFVLCECGDGSGLYHVNAIEWAASAMEMSVIGAKNVALLAHFKWTESSGNSALLHGRDKKMD